MPVSLIGVSLEFMPKKTGFDKLFRFQCPSMGRKVSYAKNTGFHSNFECQSYPCRQNETHQ